MANPILNPAAPGYASIVACYWVSDQIEVSPGVFGKGAWEAKAGTYHPAWGNPAAVACGASGRNGLKFSGAQGVDLATTNGHTTHVLDLAGPEAVVLAVARKSSATAEARVIQNCERFGSQVGLKMHFSDAATVTAKVNDAGGPNTAFNTSGAPAGQLRAYWYRKSENVAAHLYLDAAGTASAGGSASAFAYGTLERRAAIGNWGSNANLTTGEHDSYLIVVYNSDNWLAASPNASMAPVGDTEAELLAGSFYDAFLQFVAAPVITDQPDNLTVTAGQPASFTVAFTGSPTPTVQWRRNGVDIAGANSATYAFAAALADNGAQYTARITNSEDTVTSSAATLTVNAIVGGTITTRPLVRNTGTAATDPWALHAPGQAMTLFVSNLTTGALLVKRTGLLTNAAGVVSFVDAAVPVAPAYRVDIYNESLPATNPDAWGMDVLPAT